MFFVVVVVCLSLCGTGNPKSKAVQQKETLQKTLQKAETTELDSAFDSRGVNLEHCGHLPDLCS